MLAAISSLASAAILLAQPPTHPTPDELVSVSRTFTALDASCKFTLTREARRFQDGSVASSSADAYYAGFQRLVRDSEFAFATAHQVRDLAEEMWKDPHLDVRWIPQTIKYNVAYTTALSLQRIEYKKGWGVYQFADSHYLFYDQPNGQLTVSDASPQTMRLTPGDVFAPLPIGRDGAQWITRQRWEVIRGDSVQSGIREDIWHAPIEGYPGSTISLLLDRKTYQPTACAVCYSHNDKVLSIYEYSGSESRGPRTLPVSVVRIECDPDAINAHLWEITGYSATVDDQDLRVQFQAGTRLIDKRAPPRGGHVYNQDWSKWPQDVLSFLSPPANELQPRSK
jgi:hypothetical protein